MLGGQARREARPRTRRRQARQACEAASRAASSAHHPRHPLRIGRPWLCRSRRQRQRRQTALPRGAWQPCAPSSASPSGVCASWPSERRTRRIRRSWHTRRTRRRRLARLTPCTRQRQCRRRCRPGSERGALTSKLRTAAGRTSCRSRSVSARHLKSLEGAHAQRTTTPLPASERARGELLSVAGSAPGATPASGRGAASVTTSFLGTRKCKLGSHAP